MRHVLRPIALLVVLALAGGCSLLETDQAKAILTNANGYAFYETRYAEACVEVVGPPTCKAQQTWLKAWKKHLGEANDALKRGGRAPLQLKQIKRDAKAKPVK